MKSNHALNVQLKIIARRDGMYLVHKHKHQVGTSRQLNSQLPMLNQLLFYYYRSSLFVTDVSDEYTNTYILHLYIVYLYTYVFCVCVCNMIVAV